MDEQSLIDRILENENLTDNLEDEDANLLLDWGTDHARRMIQDVADEDLAGAKINAVMAVMRKVNRIVGERASLPSQDLVTQIDALGQLHTWACGGACNHDVAAIEVLFASRAVASPSQTLQSLLDWLAPGQSQGEPTTSTEQALSALVPGDLYGEL